MPFVHKPKYRIELDVEDDGSYSFDMSEYYQDWTETHGLDGGSDAANFRFAPARGKIVLDNRNHVFSADVEPEGRTITSEQLRTPHHGRITAYSSEMGEVVVFEGTFNKPVIDHHVGFTTATFDIENFNRSAPRETLEFAEQDLTLAQLFDKAAQIYNQGTTGRPLTQFDAITSGAMRFSGDITSFLQQLMLFGNGYAFEDERGRLGFASVFALRGTTDAKYNISPDNYIIEADGTNSQTATETIRNTARIRIQEAAGDDQTDMEPEAVIATIPSLSVKAGTSVSQTLAIRVPEAGDTWRWKLSAPVLVRGQLDNPGLLPFLSIATTQKTAYTNVTVVVSNTSASEDVVISNIEIKARPVKYLSSEERTFENEPSIVRYETRNLTLPEWYGLDSAVRAEATLNHISDPLLTANVRLLMFQPTVKQTKEVHEMNVGDVVEVSVVDSNDVFISAKMMIAQVSTRHLYQKVPRKDLYLIALNSIGFEGQSTWGQAQWGTAIWK